MERLATNCRRYEAETRRLLAENQAGRFPEWTKHRRPAASALVLTLSDNSRVYDRVCRHDLLQKMQWKGVSPHLIQWIQAWLDNRQKLVTFEAAKSKKTILKHRVHQGSILSPMLFLFYIDDLHWCSGDLHVSLFADDVAIWAEDRKLHMVETRLQQGLDAVTTWSMYLKMLLIRMYVLLDKIARIKVATNYL